MDKFPKLTEADRRECIANLRAFMKADRLATRLSGNPPGAAPTHTSPTNRTGTHTTKPVRKTRSKQADFLSEECSSGIHFFITRTEAERY